MQTQPGGLVTFLPLRSWERRTRPSWPMTDTWDLERTAEALFVHGEIDLAAADSFEERASEAVMDGPGVQRPHRPLWSDVHGLRGDARSSRSSSSAAGSRSSSSRRGRCSGSSNSPL